MATSASSAIGSTGKYGDLKRRLLFLLMALVVFRTGTHIPVPGIDPDQLRALFNSQQGGILGLFNMFSGGALSRFSVFALGIMPYITASIILQLLTVVVPTLEKLQKEGVMSRIDLEKAQVRFQGAEAAYQAAQEEVMQLQAQLAERRTAVALARQNLEDCVIRAPFAGV